MNLLLGLVWGFATGAILGIAPSLGPIRGAMAGVMLLRSGHRLWLAGGVLTGAGATDWATLAWATARSFRARRAISRLTDPVG